MKIMIFNQGNISANSPLKINPNFLSLWSVILYLTYYLVLLERQL